MSNIDTNTIDTAANATIAKVSPFKFTPLNVVMQLFMVLMALIMSFMNVSAYAFDLSADEDYQFAEQAITGNFGALRVLKNAADSGDVNAQYYLGVMFRDGQGVWQDYAQAVAWFRKAAIQGNTNAQNNLGVMYLDGQGVDQDYVQAVAWFRKAADRGNAAAQNNLGIRYKNGQGVAQNRVIAYALYSLSIENNSVSNDQHQNAISNRQNISEYMTESEIEKSQALTQRMKFDGVLKTIDYYCPVC